MNHLWSKQMRCFLSSITLILAIWLKNAQPSGVANIKMKPTRPVWSGAFAHG